MTKVSRKSCQKANEDLLNSYFERGIGPLELVKETGLGESTLYRYYAKYNKAKKEAEEAKKVAKSDVVRRKAVPKRDRKNVTHKEHITNLTESEQEKRKELLGKLQELRTRGYSIRSAAEEIGITYTRAWTILNEAPVLNNQNHRSKAEPGIKELKEAAAAANQTTGQLEVDQLENDKKDPGEIMENPEATKPEEVKTKEELTPEPEPTPAASQLQNRYGAYQKTYKRGDIVCVFRETEAEQYPNLVKVDKPDNTSIVNYGKQGRYAVIIQNDKGNLFSTNVIVAFVTSQIKRLDLNTHVLITSKHIPFTSMVMLEQIQTLDKRQIKKVGYLSSEELKEVDEALKVSLQIEPDQKVAEQQPEPEEIKEGAKLNMTNLAKVSRFKINIQGVYNYTPSQEEIEINAGEGQQLIVAKDKINDFIEDLIELAASFN